MWRCGGLKIVSAMVPVFVIVYLSTVTEDDRIEKTPLMLTLYNLCCRCCLYNTDVSFRISVQDRRRMNAGLNYLT